MIDNDNEGIIGAWLDDYVDDDFIDTPWTFALVQRLHLFHDDMSTLLCERRDVPAC